jgi:WD40 repeat protein
VHDVLNASTPSVPTPTAGGGANVTITAVAWSKEQPYLVDRGFDGSPGEGTELEEEEGHYPSFVKRVRIKNTQRVDDSSIVAAGGSNGVVVAWNAHSALLGDTASNQSGLFHKSRVEPSVTASIGQPEAVFLAHSRAVNRLAWHPGHRPYLLLTASQDGTVKLWDRRASSSAISKTSAQQKSWFHFGHSQLPSRTIVQTSNNWHCISTYTPKCEAVRDIKWNPHLQDVFAMVSDNGTLCVYDIRLNRPVMKTTSHGGEATSVDWHPSEKYVLATGGGRDRCVKVWDIESALNIHKADETVPIVSNSGSYLSDYTSESGHSEQVKLEDDGRNTPQLTTHTIGSTSPIKRNASGLALSRSMHYKSYSPVHTLFVSSPITSLCWRPNTGETESLGDSIVAVATSPIQGANAGGNGTIGLWACKYPFVPISVVEGHEEGAVTAFTFVDISSVPGTTAYNRSSSQPAIPLASHHEPLQQFSKRNSDQNVATMSRIFRESALRSIVLSVGRDGQCLLQDFSLG